jgi:putative ABC transport system permease protein
MNRDRRLRWASRIVSIAAPVAPKAVRDDWRREWQAELAALADMDRRARRPVSRALGAFADAFWLRQRSVADFVWIGDVQQAARQLVRHGSFAVTAVGILALGLGATVAMFSVMDQILLRPLPYASADRIVTLWESRSSQNELLEVAPGNLIDWRARGQSFAYMAGVEPWALDVANASRPEVWFSAKVTDGFFESFGVTPLHGRFFRSDEYQKGRDRVLVLAEDFWRQRFGADPSIIGQQVIADEGALTIIGIAPASFEPRVLPTATGHRNVWQPKALEEYETRIRAGGYWAAVARLRPGVTLESAQAEMQAIAQQLATEYPRTNDKAGVRVVPLRDHLVGNVELAVSLIAGAAGLVLLIACVNVANLLLARGSAREREMAIRIALGARRGRIVQQLLIESVVIAAIGGVAGALLASWALAAIARVGPPTVPWIETLRLDWRAAIFAVIASLVVAIVSGILPAWRVSRTGLANAGRQTATAGAAQHRVRAALVVAEVALALVLVTGAGLLLRSFVGLMAVDPGFQRDRVLVTQVFAWDHNPTPAQLRSFFDTTLARVEALPAVQAAGAVSAMPFIESNINIQNVVAISGRAPGLASEAPRAYLSVATPGYFEAMRIPLKAGRLLDQRDGQHAKRVAVITDSLARHYWSPADDPIGDTLQFRFSGTPTEVEIVGVVGSLRHDSLDRGARDELFMPLAQVPFGSMTFVIRSATDASALLEPVRAAIWSVNPAQTIYRSATLDELVMKTVSPRRFALLVILGFASLAMMLSIAGVYSVLSAVMSTRVRELGVRVALGASRADLVRMVVGRGLVMASLGVVIGVLGSLGVARLLQAFLFGITPADPVVVAVAVTLMTLAAATACYLPARRAAGADPVAVLRIE